MTFTIVEVNALTGETTEREMTPNEIKQREANLQEIAQAEAEQAANEAARQAALDKLRAIGLTDEEIAALVGN